MDETGGEEEDVRSYWMTLSKYRILEFERRSCRSHSHGELVVEVGVDLSQRGPRNE